LAKGTINRKIVIAFLILISVISCNEKDDKIIGVTSSASPEASNAGQEIFLKGGNAIDAAVAVSFTLGVTEPAMSGLGGGTQVLISLNNGQPFAINGTTLSPANTPSNVSDTLTYQRRSTIPSTVKVLDYLWKTYGSGKVSWEELLKPAIELAENGFPVGNFRSKVYKQYEDKLLESKFNTSIFLIDGERIPKEGEVLKQPVLAKTLKRLAKYGADDFYNGEIAQKIAKDMEKHGGWITLSDLNNFPSPKEINALSVEYKGMKVYSQPPPCGGLTTLLALNLMAEISKDDNVSSQDITQALYLAHYDRDKNPITDLEQYESSAMAKLSKDYAKSLLQGTNETNNIKEEPNSGETTHFSVVDSNGNAVAVTASINAYFGALSASKELGFLYNTYMDDFIFENSNHPFAIRPNAMAYSSMSPTIVQNQNENVLVLGSPGGARIISTVAQTTAKWIEVQNIEKLIKSPRIHVVDDYVYFENINDTISINMDFLIDNKLQFKHANENLVITQGLNAYFGGVHAIAKENNKWIGVADPRRDGNIIIVNKR
jgi:gamma-glutamyltranspeptidase/glutathione hydrolase